MHQSDLKRKIARTRRQAVARFGKVFDECCDLNDRIFVLEKKREVMLAKKIYENEEFRRTYFSQFVCKFTQIHGAPYNPIIISQDCAYDIDSIKRGLEMHAINVRKEDILKEMSEIRLDNMERMSGKIEMLIKLRQANFEKYQNTMSLRISRICQILETLLYLSRDGTVKFLFKFAMLNNGANKKTVSSSNFVERRHCPEFR